MGEIFEECCDGFRSLACQFSATGHNNVVKRPAGHYTIEGIDKEGTYYGEHAQCNPSFVTMAEFLVCTHHVALGTAANDELGHHQRHANQDDEENVNQQEGATAVLPQHIGETPDIA